MTSDRTCLPLERFGLIGDGHTAALVADDGSVDWLCVPRFDGPAIFWRLLDAGKGGFFQINPAGPYRAQQAYESTSNVLRTAFRTPTGVLILRDGMPVRWHSAGLAADRRLLRVLACAEGEVEVVAHFAPRPGFGTVRPRFESGSCSVAIQGGGWTGYLCADVPLEMTPEGLTARFTLKAGEGRVFDFDWGSASPPRRADPGARAAALDETRQAWHRWASACEYEGPYREQVLRSALALRLLVYEPTGAVIAAPTTSLPEVLGGERNWDYRYAWLRDAALTLSTLFALGFRGEARRFFAWLLRTLQHCPTALDLGVVYDVDGRPVGEERLLGHLEGYEASAPVRIGNAASLQFQMDVYGELVDCLHRCHLLEEVDVATVWPWFRQIIDCVAANWRRPDRGIWEVRSAPQHFVHSKAMAWVALDRGARLATSLGLGAEASGWSAQAARIRRQVLARGSGELRAGALVRAYGEAIPDASVLLLPAVGFIHAADRRMRATVAGIRAELESGDLLYRYRADDALAGQEGAFLPSAFWLADVLAMQGKVDEARQRFERLLALATPLGLYAEEMDPATRRHLGNFPQGLTHLSLINSALRLALPEEQATTLGRAGQCRGR